jgi:Fe-S cluster assembly ATPase SufC
MLVRKDKNIETATSLMQMALALLDEADTGLTVTACRLQAAIDSANGTKRLQPGKNFVSIGSDGFSNLCALLP